MTTRRVATSIVTSIAAGAFSLLLSGAVHAADTGQANTDSTIESTNTTQINVDTYNSSTSQTGSEAVVTAETESSVSVDHQVSSSDQNGPDTIAPTQSDSKLDKTTETTVQAEQADKAARAHVAGGPTLNSGSSNLRQANRNANGFAQNANAFIQTQLSSPTAIETPAGSNPSHPAPLPISGALGQINALMSQIVLPMILRHGPSIPLAQSIVFLSVLLVVGLVTLLAAKSRIQQFVLWLKMSGFSHAARSDASALFSLFATQTKMSFAWASGPAVSSSFYGVRNTKFNREWSVS